MKHILFILIIISISISCFGDTIPTRNKKEVKIVGHRGNAKYCPENTFSSYKSAVELGADIIETDIRLTKDGIPVFCHDNEIDRISNGTGRVIDKTLSELRGYDFGYSKKFGDKFKNEPILTLEEGLKYFKEKKVSCFLEIKHSEVIEPTAKIFAKIKPSKDKIMFLVWGNADAKLLNEKLKGYKIYHLAPLGDYLKAENKDEFFNELKNIGVRGLSVDHVPLFNMNKEDLIIFLILSAKYKMPVGVWTVDDTSTINKIINYQVMGVIKKKTYIGKIDLITTNDPGLALLLTGKDIKK